MIRARRTRSFYPALMALWNPNDPVLQWTLHSCVSFRPLVSPSFSEELSEAAPANSWRSSSLRGAAEPGFPGPGGLFRYEVARLISLPAVTFGYFRGRATAQNFQPLPPRSSVYASGPPCLTPCESCDSVMWVGGVLVLMFSLAAAIGVSSGVLSAVCR